MKYVWRVKACVMASSMDGMQHRFTLERLVVSGTLAKAERLLAEYAHEYCKQHGCTVKSAVDAHSVVKESEDHVLIDL